MKKIMAILICVIAIVSVLLLHITNKLDKYQINEDIFTFEFSEKVEFSNAVIKTSDKGTTLTSGDRKMTLSTTPIYYSNEKTIFLPLELGVVDYHTGKTNKLNHYTKIIEKDGQYYADYFGEEKILYSNFLYDGNGMYMFFENLKIKVGNNEYEIEPGSCIKLKNNNSCMEIYSNKSDEIRTIDIYGEDIIAVSNYGYEVNLKLTSLERNDGEQLLFKNIAVLEQY